MAFALSSNQPLKSNMKGFDTHEHIGSASHYSLQTPRWFDEEASWMRFSFLHYRWGQLSRPRGALFFIYTTSPTSVFIPLRSYRYSAPTFELIANVRLRPLHCSGAALRSKYLTLMSFLRYFIVSTNTLARGILKLLVCHKSYLGFVPSPGVGGASFVIWVLCSSH